MRIAIYAPGKTGSSALFALLSDAMPGRTDRFFEVGPHHRFPWYRRRIREGLRRLAGAFPRPMLAKFIISSLPAAPASMGFQAFDRHILLLRDPRDRLVSSLLYSAYNDHLAASPAKASACIELLLRKERDPGAVSLMELVEAFAGFGGSTPEQWLALYRAKALDMPLCFGERYPDLFELRYEDLVEKKYGPLSAYTGLALSDEPVVDASLSRVVRTKGRGSWRDWFTAEDIAFFRPMLAPYLDRYYPDAHWATNPQPVIQSEHASRYVARIVTERRQQLGLGSWPQDFAFCAGR